ncbi:nuclear transport factor 2 family protein [Eikenella sp. S3360]|uniref:Nuclear transport factor 2 family protein n=1 Tax=Eikenella glucosivorans TaxID=2766967 RepID=A0ABS0N9H7_9NEIS|nr:nuclear transport factor 2 family protein [Eikenella glucosivorans]MBH5328936.1 nuclear transport factor 2 family protein [Eikenella glucosivorans]
MPFDQELLAAVRKILDAGATFDLDILTQSYAPDLQMLFIQPDGGVLQYGYEQQMKFFRDGRDAGLPPVTSEVRYHAVQVQDGIGYVIAARRMGMGEREQNTVFNLMLRRNGQGRWQIFREHDFIGQTQAA